jgi:hypothetical protein
VLLEVTVLQMCQPELQQRQQLRPPHLQLPAHHLPLRLPLLPHQLLLLLLLLLLCPAAN